MESVTLAAGELSRFFAWSLAADGSPVRVSTTTPSSSLALRKERVYNTFQAIVDGSGAVTATVIIDASDDDKTGEGREFPVTLQGSTTVLSGALFNGYVDRYSRYVPPVQIGDVVTGNGIPAATTVTAIASASSLTISNAATLTGAGFFPVFQSLNWIKTPLGTLTLTGTNFDTDGFSTAAAWRWVRARVTALTGTAARIQVLMGV